jgi:hypothetical protein
MTSSVVKRRSRSNFRIVDQLNADWDALVDDSTAHVDRWRSRHAVFEGCFDLDDVLSAVSREPDPALRALLAEDVQDDPLAGRVVLQSMLGKTVRMAARDPRASVDDYIGALWLRIRTYPRLERPDHIAANLALDTLKCVTSEQRWARRGMTVIPVWSEAVLEAAQSASLEHSHLDHSAAVPELSAAGVITTATELGLLDEPYHDVLLTVYSEGLSGRDAARRHQTTPEMIRYRCSRAVRRLAQHSDELLEAA